MGGRGLGDGECGDGDRRGWRALALCHSSGSSGSSRSSQRSLALQGSLPRCVDLCPCVPIFPCPHVPIYPYPHPSLAVPTCVSLSPGSVHTCTPVPTSLHGPVSLYPFVPVSLYPFVPVSPSQPCCANLSPPPLPGCTDPCPCPSMSLSQPCCANRVFPSPVSLHSPCPPVPIPALLCHPVCPHPLSRFTDPCPHPSLTAQRWHGQGRGDGLFPGTMTAIVPALASVLGSQPRAGVTACLGKLRQGTAGWDLPRQPGRERREQSRGRVGAWPGGGPWASLPPANCQLPGVPPWGWPCSPSSPRHGWGAACSGLSPRGSPHRGPLPGG